MWLVLGLFFGGKASFPWESRGRVSWKIGYRPMSFRRGVLGSFLFYESTYIVIDATRASRSQSKCTIEVTNRQKHQILYLQGNLADHPEAMVFTKTIIEYNRRKKRWLYIGVILFLENISSFVRTGAKFFWGLKYLNFENWWNIEKGLTSTSSILWINKHSY